MILRGTADASDPSMPVALDALEQLTERIIGCAIAVHREMGVQDTVIIELKAVERYHPVHLAQLITYLKLTGRPAGLLFNFNVTALKTGVKRASHPDVYRLKTQGDRKG